MNQSGFKLPTSEEIIKQPMTENEMLIKKKQRLLTELAALENNISLFDFLDPNRDQLMSCVIDVPYDVQLFNNVEFKCPPIDEISSSKSLADLIVDIGSHPTDHPYKKQRPPPICEDIVKHSNEFFAQMKASLELRSGINTAFCIIPQRNKETPNPKPSEPIDLSQEEDPPKQIHPFFPDLGLSNPLKGLMKEQLGEFPNFIRDTPTESECKEYRWMLNDDDIDNYLLSIAGSSDDDDFDPDLELEKFTKIHVIPSTQQMQYIPQARPM